MATQQKNTSTLLVIIAFAIVYVVWGSTYFFIQMAIHGFPPMLMGAARFLLAGGLMLAWCLFKGENVWNLHNIKTAAISGLLMLFAGMGTVIWAEQSIPSAMVAIMVSTNPIWFVVLDRANWAKNFKSKTTILGLIVGFGGVFMLFGEAINKSINGGLSHEQLIGLILLLLSPGAWAYGGLYSKKHGSTASASVNTTWQMLIAGVAYLPSAALHNEFSGFNISAVPTQAWLAIGYLVLFGSIVAFSAYAWLLSVRPATQVSTHSYVNPVIAVLLGVCFANEVISNLQLLGLFVILFSVLLVNYSQYAKKATAR